MLVRSLVTDTAAGRTFELFTGHGPAPSDWTALFGALAPDAAGEVDAVGDPASLPSVAEEPGVVQEDLARRPE